MIENVHLILKEICNSIELCEKSNTGTFHINLHVE
jgi:hypothetical protein